MDYETAQISEHLHELRLPDAARAWLMDVWRVIQVIDDAADGEPVGPDEAEAAATAIFVRMPLNAFWQANAGALVPILALQLAKWKEANSAERLGEADARSFMWRAGYYDLVAAVCLLCGMENEAGIALHLYGEVYEKYCEEFTCQPQQ